jgi:transcriptional regulator with XRE-family HTH domain
MKSLRQLRKERNHTLKSLSEVVKIDVGDLSRIERGLILPTLKNRIRLEQVFGEKINWLATSYIDSEPYGFPVAWEDAEREFRRMVHIIGSLPVEEQKIFIVTALNHFRKMFKNLILTSKNQ